MLSGIDEVRLIVEAFRTYLQTRRERIVALKEAVLLAAVFVPVCVTVAPWQRPPVSPALPRPPGIPFYEKWAKRRCKPIPSLSLSPHEKGILEEIDDRFDRGQQDG